MSFQRWLLVVERRPAEDEIGPAYRLWLRSLDGRGDEPPRPLFTVDELYEALMAEVGANDEAEAPLPPASSSARTD